MILMIDDEPKWMKEYTFELEEAGFEVLQISNVDSLMVWLSTSDNVTSLEIIILDMMMPPGEKFANIDTKMGTLTGEFLLQYLHTIIPEVPKILLSNKDLSSINDSTINLINEAFSKEDLLPEDLLDVVCKYVR